MNFFIQPEILNGLILGFKYLYWFSPLWLTIIFTTLCFEAWISYRQTQFWQKEGNVLLEIKIPREINKSPAAMEMALEVFFQTGGESTWIDRLWKGQTRSWFSLEIVSLEGNIRFFVWTKPKHRNVIESQFYSQYPGIEIYEVEDYTKPFYFNPNKTGLWACEFKLSEPDPFPIKTYLDYGLGDNPKEEHKIDPMTPMLEFLGSMTAGNNIWIQIIIRAHKDKKKKPLDWNKKWKKLAWNEEVDAWKDDAEKEKNKILDKLKVDAKEGGYPRIPSKGEAERIAALERSISKTPFDVGIRGIYITEKDKFNPANIGGLTGSLKQFGSLNLNGFKPTGWLTIFDYPWQKWFSAEDKLRPKVLEEYKLRRFFYSPYKGKKFYSKPFVLNTEELATIFHFPGEVAATPTLEKIPSVKSKAPANLPI